MKTKISTDWQILRHGNRADYSIIIGITILFLLIIAMNVRFVFNLMSNQTEEIGQMQLENIRNDLESKIINSENTIMQVANEAEIMINNRDSQEVFAAFFINKKREQLKISNGVCFNVYIANNDWTIIPDFNMPSDYHATERLWYKGAAENPEVIYITEPYIDAMTGMMCYTMSKMLSDNETVVALDFNFSDMQDSISKMVSDSERHALIVSKTGMIIGYSDMSLVGEKISKKLPEYEPILERLLTNNNHESFTEEVDGNSHTIFSSKTKNGWYMILSVDNWTLHKDDYRQMALNTIISLFMLVIIIIFYLVGVKNKLQAEQALHVKEVFLSNLSGSLREPLSRILTLSNVGTLGTDVNPAENAAQVRKSAEQLSHMLDNLFTLSTLVSTENEISENTQIVKLPKTSKNVRIGIIAVLIMALVVSLGICINNIIHQGDMKMNREVDIYDYQLSNWIAKHKSILSMFTSMISERPQMMDDYATAVTWLNDIAKNYPEISACYMANPYKEHTVIMNTGWEGPPGWRVELRPWYIDTEKSEDGFSISAPYYDDQTGLYCVTLSQVVYGQNGEFLGVFGIDFFLDKLISILGESYTKDSYAFLVDKNGIIINHPSEDFQLSVDNTTVINTTNYFKSYTSEQITDFNDYNNYYSACIAKKNKISDFTVMFVNRWWNIYGNIVVLGTLLLILFGLCISAVSMLINKLIKWQQDVNRQLKTAADTAVAAGKAKSQFLAQMSHEIRTPINAVIGMNEMILRESHEKDTIKYAQNAAAASEALLTLINDILDFSKIESGKMELIEETYQLDELIKNLINMVKSRAEKKRLEFKIKVNENTPNELFGDSVRIRQVVLNFLTNAVKYTKVGSVDFRINFEEQTPDEIMLKFSVKDTGIGIKDEDKKRLFKDFERFDSHENKNIEGTGLGLAITAKLVKMMNGEIIVDSVYGEGSTFTVMLPQKVMGKSLIGNFKDRVKPRQDDKEEYKPEFIAPEAEILVVDDNEMNLLVVTSLLKATRVKVDTAMSGMSALKKLAEKPYDVIFLDQMMPSLDGIQTLKLAKKMEDNKSKNAPVIALTANAISGAKEMFLHEGFTDYLSKPINAKEMEEMLMTYLPLEKLHAPKSSDNVQVKEDTPAEDVKPKYINVEMGLQYSAGITEMYKSILMTFCQLKDDKQVKMQEAFEREDWENYTILVHALKSTSLTVGGEELSKAAKDLEMAGKMITSKITTELEKHQGIEHIKEHHANVMHLYDEMVEEGQRLIETL